MSAENKSRKPKVAISSCLLGEPVRYDAGNKMQPQLADFFHLHCEVIPVCPEVEMGLGVPRAPIEVVFHKQHYHLRTVAAPHTDLTRLARDTAQQVLQNLGELDGWIFKARSPSCGLMDTPVFNQEGKQVERGQGIFASSILSAMPWLPCATENRLGTETERQQFLQRVSILQQINNWLLSEHSYEQLLELEQNIRDRVNSVPETSMQKYEMFLHDATQTLNDRFYHYRLALMQYINQM